MGAAGFVHYFKGPTSSDGSCMSFCLWDRAAEPGRHPGGLATRRPRRCPRDVRPLRPRVPPGDQQAGGSFTFEPYDPPRRARSSSPPASPPPERPHRHASTPSAELAPGLLLVIAIGAVARAVHDPHPVDRRRSHRRPGHRDRRGGRRRPGPAASRSRPGFGSPPHRVLRARHRPARRAPQSRRDRPDRRPGDSGLIVVTMAASFALVLLLARAGPGREPAGHPARGRLGRLRQHRDRGDGAGHRRSARARSPTRSRPSPCSGRWPSSSIPPIGACARPAPALVRAVGRRRRPRHEPGHRHQRRLWPGSARRRDGRQAHPQRADGAAPRPDRDRLGGARRCGRPDGATRRGACAVRSRCSCSASWRSRRCARSGDRCRTQAAALRHGRPGP